MRINRKYTLGLIGCGHMGMAIARGAVHKEYLERFQIAVYDPDPRIQDECRLHRFIVLDSEKEVAEKSHITLLAVTPQQCEEVLEKLKDADINCMLSIVTGVSISHLQEKLNNVPVIRSMPNTPLQINAGATALCMSDNCKADDYDFVFQLFNSMGTTRTIPEEMMNNVVAVHGSIPAYVYYFIECILNDAVDRGMDEIDARALLVQTFIGAAQLLAENSKTPIDEFIDEVCSKGGTTIEAINELKKQNMEQIIHDANQKCIERANQLGR